ncbi:MAG TPA: sigma 54-interacting transcriptional regulator [Methylomirabilota bacterium]|nr:sigma 54-interacting transcriptional regulator [Methylomirabilota bacterium]
MEGLEDLLGESAAIQAIRDTVRRLLARPPGARRLPSILIQGETGTGKGLIARLIHRQGPRAAGPFVDVNCAAIPETLLEAELFGFERGAFTDARRSKPGLFQTAHRGTIFLDEVGLLPDALQAKLLKVLEEQAVRRLGSTASEPVDVWIISATNADLQTAIAERRFREDLYHRLAVLTLQMPPLRERGRDVVLLAERFLARACADYGLPAKTLSPEAQTRLLAYSWPGNVRELANTIERVALLAEDAIVRADLLELPVVGPAARPAPAAASLDEAMRSHVLETLTQTGWNISRTAALLGISRNTLRARIDKFGLRSGSAATPTPGRRPARVPTPSPAVAEPPPPAYAPAAPGPAPALAAPAAIRWETRRVTLLRARLLTPGSEDELADTSRALDVLLDKVRGFGGRVEEVSPRAIGAVFGLEPVEDAPRRGAHAAMAIEKAAERGRRGEGEPFTVKTGIHVGQVLVGQSGARLEIAADSMRSQWTVLDSLLAAAGPDGILVSPAAAPFLERRFDLAAESGVHGTVYRLRGRERKGLAVEGEMGWFVGRRQELDLLKSCLGSARAGHGQIVGIVGEAGIGKSRLLYEFRQALRGEAITYVEGHCLSYGATIPFLPALEILRHGCRIAYTDTPDTIAHKLRASLQSLGIDPEATLPFLLQFIGLKDNADALGSSRPEDIRTRTFHILRQMCVNASRQRPLIIAVEDMHWVDAASEALGGMVESLEGVPLLLILTYRPGYRPPWHGKSHLTQIALQPLSTEDSLSILGGLLPPGRLGEPVAQLILSKAEGNPLFLEELARSVREQESLSPTVAVPGTIQEVLLARINRLAERERRLLQSAAVIGKTFALDVLRVLADLPEAELGDALGQLREGEFLFEASSGPEVEYSFKHGLTHEVAYGSLRPDQRRVLHDRIVEATERLYPDRLSEFAERLADHAALGEVWDKAVDYLRAAGARAFARGVVEESLERYEKALALTRQLPATPENARRAIDVRLDLHSPLIVLGQMARLIRLHEESEQVARDLGDPPRLGHVLWRMAHYSWIDGRYRDGLACAEQALHIATDIGNDELRVAATYASALNRFSLGSYREAIDLFASIADGPDAERAKRLLALTIPAYISSCSWLGHCWSFFGDPQRGLRYCDRAVAAADASDHPQSQAIAYTLRVLPLLYLGATTEALALAERALELCKAKGLLLWYPGASSMLGWALALAGRAAEALPHLESGPSILEGMHSTTHLSLMYTWWGEGLLLAGQLEEATRKVDRAVEVARACHEAGYLTDALQVQAQILAASDPLDLERAATAYRETQRQAEELGKRTLVARCQLGLGRLYQRAGQPAPAREHLSTAAAMCRDMGVGLWLKEAEAALASGERGA